MAASEQTPESQAQPAVDSFGRFPINGTQYEKEFIEQGQGKILAILHWSRSSQYQSVKPNLQEAEAWIEKELAAGPSFSRRKK